MQRDKLLALSSMCAHTAYTIEQTTRCGGLSFSLSHLERSTFKYSDCHIFTAHSVCDKRRR